MDRESATLQAKIYGVKTKAKIGFVFDVVAVSVLLLGAYNLLIATGTDVQPILAGSRTIAPHLVFGAEGAIYHGMDIALMVGGAAFVWFR